jgi:type I restriction enzyme S subunit
MKTSENQERPSVGQHQGAAMKTGWQTTTLGAAFTTVTGNTPPKNNQELFGQFMPLVKPPELLDSTVDSAEDGLSEAGAKVARIAPPNSILVSCIGNLGKVGLNTVQVAFNQQINAISADIKRAVPAFMFYQVLSCDFKDQLQALSSGTTVPIVNKSRFNSIEIVLPPLAEQERIVGVLDEAFAGLATAQAHAEQNLKNARALFDSHLHAVFSHRGPGWVETKLKSITTKIGSGATPRGGGESYKSEGISLIRSLNVHDLGFKYAKLAFLDDAQADELSNVEVQPRDVLLNITGASVARCAIVPPDVLPARVNQHVAIIRPIAEKLDADFLHYLLISKHYKDQLLKTGEEGGSTRQAITKAQIQEFSIKYPAALKDQKSIVAKLDVILAETQRLAGLYEQKLAALAALKKSLLHQAFSGAL